MKFAILLNTLLNSFATVAPNLCADVYVDAAGDPYTDVIGQTLSRYCAWTGPDAPVWDANVCCTIDGDGAHCSVPDKNGRCVIGYRMYCEYAAAVPGGGVVCYQPFPSMCDAGFCIEAPPNMPPAPQASLLGCCNDGGACQPIVAAQIWDCEGGGGTLLSCFNGVTNADGTMDCWD
jgi:hypothetical protein